MICPDMPHCRGAGADALPSGSMHSGLPKAGLHLSKQRCSMDAIKFTVGNPVVAASPQLAAADTRPTRTARCHRKMPDYPARRGRGASAYLLISKMVQPCADNAGRSRYRQCLHR